MNLNEYKGSFLLKSPSSSSHSFIPNTAKIGNAYIVVIAKIQSFTSQIFGVIGPLGETLMFFSSLVFEVQTTSDHKTQKIKLHPFRALESYKNEKNLIHGRVI